MLKFCLSLSFFPNQPSKLLDVVFSYTSQVILNNLVAEQSPNPSPPTIGTSSLSKP